MPPLPNEEIGHGDLLHRAVDETSGEIISSQIRATPNARAASARSAGED
jgi:hypothetical protein